MKDLKETIENALYSMGKLKTDECSEVAENIQFAIESESGNTDGYTLKGHKCKKIAEIDTHLSDREIWMGKLTEIFNPSPDETHCLHIKTPFKEIVLGVCDGDAWWLVAFGQMLLDESGKKMIKPIQIHHYLKSIKK